MGLVASLAVPPASGLMIRTLAVAGEPTNDVRNDHEAVDWIETAANDESD